MSPKLVLAIIILLGIMMIIPLACGLAPQPPAPEAVVVPTSVMVVQVAATSALLQEPAPAQAAQEEPTSAAQAAAPLSAQEVIAQTLVNLNLRQGPGTDYPVLASLPANSEVKVIGRLKDNAWLQVRTEQGEGWINGQTGFVKVEAAALAALPVIEAPPPAYDTGNPMVQKVLDEIPLVIHHQGSYTCASHGGLNHLLPEVKNGHIIGPHAGDFVYNGDNVLFEYNNGGLQLVRESPMARFEGGVKYLSLAETMKLFAEGKIVWTGSLGRWPGRGVTGCDPVAKP